MGFCRADEAADTLTVDPTRTRLRGQTSRRLSTSAADQDFHIYYEPLMVAGRIKPFPNLLTYASLHARRKLNELLAAQRCSPFNAAEIGIERRELDTTAYGLDLDFAEAGASD